jgi:ribonuclease Z
MMPMPGRFLTAVAVRTAGAVYLLDCGEGTQIPYKSQHIGVRALRLVAITHLHADHCLGLPGLLMLRAQVDDPAALTIVGPTGCRQFVRNVIHDLGCYIDFQLDFIEIDCADPDQRRKGPPPVVYQDELVKLRWLPLRHSVPCVGYRLEEHERPGKLDVRAAARLGLSPGPLLGRLQAGEPVTAPDGTQVEPQQVLGPSRPGRHLAFCTDTRPCRNLYRMLDQVDLAFLEGMFLPAEAAEAEHKLHLTVADAARIAGRAGALQTLLVHLSPRYDDRQAEQVDEIAARICTSVRRGHDGERIHVPYR